VSEFSNTGAALSGSTGYTVGSLNLPVAIAMDPSGNAWVVNSGNSTVSKLSSTGQTGTVYSGGSLSSPKSVAVDGSSNVWIANGGSANVTQISAGGTLASYPGTSGTLSSAIAITPK
jgi:streptogramin lyase